MVTIGAFLCGEMVPGTTGELKKAGNLRAYLVGEKI